METKIVGQWTEKVFGNVYRDSKQKMTLYTFTDNAFNDIPNEYWVLLLNKSVTPVDVIQEVAGKKSKTTRGMLGALECIDLTIKALVEIIDSPLKDENLEALAIMKRFNFSKLENLMKIL